MSRDDQYEELPLGLEEFLDDDQWVRLTVHLLDGPDLTFWQVRHSPVRHRGYWHIEHGRYERDGVARVTSLIPEGLVRYFTVHTPVSPAETDGGTQ